MGLQDRKSQKPRKASVKGRSHGAGAGGQEFGASGAGAAHVGLPGARRAALGSRLWSSRPFCRPRPLSEEVWLLWAQGDTQAIGLSL